MAGEDQALGLAAIACVFKRRTDPAFTLRMRGIPHERFRDGATGPGNVGRREWRHAATVAELGP